MRPTTQAEWRAFFDASFVSPPVAAHPAFPSNPFPHPAPLNSNPVTWSWKPPQAAGVVSSPQLKPPLPFGKPWPHPWASPITQESNTPPGMYRVPASLLYPGLYPNGLTIPLMNPAGMIQVDPAAFERMARAGVPFRTPLPDAGVGARMINPLPAWQQPAARKMAMVSAKEAMESLRRYGPAMGITIDPGRWEQFNTVASLDWSPVDGMPTSLRTPLDREQWLAWQRNTWQNIPGWRDQLDVAMNQNREIHAKWFQANGYGGF